MPALLGRSDGAPGLLGLIVLNGRLDCVLSQPAGDGQAGERMSGVDGQGQV